MTAAEIQERTAVIIDAMRARQQPDGVPMCAVLEEELGLVNHEDVHAFINGLVASWLGRGAVTPQEFVIAAFAFGRKWGLMEAADAFADFDAS
jgi:hypothetical protein